MKKIYLAFVALFFAVVLIACGKTKDSIDSSKISVQSSAASSTQKNGEEVSEVSSKANFDLDMARLKELGYTVPQNIKDYVGTYSVTGKSGEQTGWVIDLAINEDGSYRKLTKIYEFVNSNYSYAYFDKNQNVQMKNLMINIEGTNFFGAPPTIYYQGVVVEKFGNLYLIDVASIETYNGLYIDENGEVDELASLLKSHLNDTDGIKTPPSLEEFDNFLPMETYWLEDFYRESSNLERYDGIKNGEVVIEQMTLTRNEEVNPLVKASITQFLTQDYLDTLMKGVNGLYQLTLSNQVVEGQNMLPELIDVSQVYRQNGEKITPKWGVKSGYTAAVFDGQNIYRANSTDGKYIIAD